VSPSIPPFRSLFPLLKRKNEPLARVPRLFLFVVEEGDDVVFAQVRSDKKLKGMEGA
jgi:hypothetical protein